RLGQNERGRPTRRGEERPREAAQQVVGTRPGPLLEGDGGTGALEGLLGLVGGFLVDALQQSLRSVVDQVLGFLQAQDRQTTDLLDDLDLLVTGGFEDDGELGLLLGPLAPATAASRGADGDRCRSGGLDVELLLEELHELGQLEKGHLLERGKQVIVAELGHGAILSFFHKNTGAPSRRRVQAMRWAIHPPWFTIFRQLPRSACPTGPVQDARPWSAAPGRRRRPGPAWP